MNKNQQLLKKETIDQGSFFQIHIDNVDVNATLTIVSDLTSSICLQEIETINHDTMYEQQQLLQQQQQQPLIEFVGHDLTLGLGTSQSLMTSFPWIVSSLLDTERSQIALPKAWLMDHEESLGMETLYFRGDSFYAPRIITILLGEYDDQHYPAAMYTSKLFMFLSNIRYRFPHAFIIVLSEPLGVLFQESQKAVYLMNDAADQDIAFIDTTGWVRYGPTTYKNPLHLNDKGQELFARKLAPLLKAKLNGLPFPVQPNPNLPYDWHTTDIGQEHTIGLEGSVSFDSAHLFTLWGSGQGPNLENFRFVYQQLSNNGSIEAVVESHAAFASCAKAGIMLREHLGHTSQQVMLGFSPQLGVFSSRNGHVVRARKLSPPYRLRLQRQGRTITASIASVTAAATWEPFYDVTIEMAPTIYLGLAVTSCDPTVVSVAKFSQVKLQGGIGRDGSYSAGRLLLQN
ncbi:hypothetical protein [Parasitella parasitica]|uniref:Uncharacterized protein n=1 Tax=Parasitella parasitica TaxID=35722 RepID=A0A0B7MT89_9FUNG|nr:hypothetical protein [Parasitella parasitica]